MDTKILYGKEIRDAKGVELEEKAKELLKRPTLAIVQVGDRAESEAYIGQKTAFGEKIGFDVRRMRFDAGISISLLTEEIKKLNAQSAIDGIIVQLPLPDSLDERQILDAIDPRKDVDGLTAQSMKQLLAGDMTGFIPATTKGIISLLNYYEIPIAGKKVVLVGRSNLVGKPTALSMLNLNATVTICHRGTENLAEETRRADILIVAAGKRSLIGREHVSLGQTIIDVGINPEIDEHGARKLFGDVDAAAVKGIAGALSPVPGGVGPLTVASLFENVLKACEERGLDK